MAAIQTATLRGTRLDSLTRARFLAAFGVVLFHATHVFHMTHDRVGGLFWVGVCGVPFFFVLSGFVLTWSAREGDSAGGFYRRRFARIYPLYAAMWLMTLLAFIGWNAYYTKGGAAAGFALLQAWKPSFSDQLNSPAWSLSVEAFFYLSFPLVLPLIRRWDVRRALTGACVSLGLILVANVVLRGLGHTFWLLLRFPPLRFLEFFAGMCLALAVAQGWRPQRWTLVAVLPILGVIVAHVLDPSPTTAALQETATPVYSAVFAAVVMSWLATREPRPGRFGALTLKLGEASYALYISHAVTFFYWEHVLPTRPLAAPFYVVTAILVSLVLHQWVERPAEKLLRPSSRPRLD